MPLAKAQLEAVIRAALATDLPEPQRRNLLLNGLARPLIHSLARKDRPDDQLRSDLLTLAPHDPLLATWLRNAIDVSPVSIPELDQALAALGDPRGATHCCLRWRSARTVHRPDEVEAPRWLGEIALPLDGHRRTFGRRHAPAEPSCLPLTGATHRMARAHFWVEPTPSAVRLGRCPGAGTLKFRGDRVPEGATVEGPGILEAGGLLLELEWAD